MSTRRVLSKKKSDRQIGIDLDEDSLHTSIMNNDDDSDDNDVCVLFVKITAGRRHLPPMDADGPQRGG